MTALQRRSLRIYQHFHGRRMTIAGLVRMNGRTYVRLSLGFGVIAALEGYFVHWIAAAVIGGVLAVVFLRDLSYFRASAAIWPMLDDLIDWNKASALATSEAEKTAPR